MLSLANRISLLIIIIIIIIIKKIIIIIIIIIIITLLKLYNKILTEIKRNPKEHNNSNNHTIINHFIFVFEKIPLHMCLYL